MTAILVHYHPCGGSYYPNCPRCCLEQAAPALLAACQLQDKNFIRQNLYPNINHLGDDDHEAWQAITAAIAEAHGFGVPE